MMPAFKYAVLKWVPSIQYMLMPVLIVICHLRCAAEADEHSREISVLVTFDVEVGSRVPFYKLVSPCFKFTPVQIVQRKIDMVFHYSGFTETFHLGRSQTVSLTPWVSFTWVSVSLIPWVNQCNMCYIFLKKN